MVLEHELQVVVPVGFLLTHPQDVTVSVDRPGEVPLPIRLRLIPARVRDQVAAPAPASAPAPLGIAWPTSAKPTDFDEHYTEFGGGD